MFLWFGMMRNCLYIRPGHLMVTHLWENSIQTLLNVSNILSWLCSLRKSELMELRRKTWVWYLLGQHNGNYCSITPFLSLGKKQCPQVRDLSSCLPCLAKFPVGGCSPNNVLVLLKQQGRHSHAGDRRDTTPCPSGKTSLNSNREDINPLRASAAICLSASSTS